MKQNFRFDLKSTWTNPIILNNSNSQSNSEKLNICLRFRMAPQKKNNIQTIQSLNQNRSKIHPGATPKGFGMLSNFHPVWDLFSASHVFAIVFGFTRSYIVSAARPYPLFDDRLQCVAHQYQTPYLNSLRLRPSCPTVTNKGSSENTTLTQGTEQFKLKRTQQTIKQSMSTDKNTSFR